MGEMGRKSGLGVSSGIAIGLALKLQFHDIDKIDLNEPFSSKEEEIKKIENAFDVVKSDTTTVLERAKTQGDETRHAILEAYMMMLMDPTLSDSVVDAINTNEVPAFKAVRLGMDPLIDTFLAMSDDYFRERAFDVIDIRDRILLHLAGIKKRDLSALPENTILVAQDLTTSDTAAMDIDNVAGIVIAGGGINSHTSILARNFEIPAIVNAIGVLDAVQDDNIVALDGELGEYYVNPADDIKRDYEERNKTFQDSKNRQKIFIDRPSTTQDGHEVIAYINIGTPQDVKKAKEVKPKGVGLFRTEFLFMQSTTVAPTEEEQYQAYKEVVEGVEGDVIIRTLDIGGDKEIEYMGLTHEENPFLGYRALRICLKDEKLFKTQLRAILRASAHGKAWIMLPMVCTIEELRHAKDIIETCKAELKAENLPFSNDIPVGIMIETSAAVVMAKEFAEESDFFSIGTNDLVQYLNATDRGNEKVSYLYSTYYPAIIRALKQVIDAANEAGILCGMCGESAADIKLAPVLVAMGLKEFSMSSSRLLSFKEHLSAFTTDEAKQLLDLVLKEKTKADVEKHLDAFYQKVRDRIK